jgi:anaerobic selenocysteine-containing dehydrogenase
MPETHYRNCNLCEAICGIEIKHEDGKIISIAGDKLDPFSRGHICPKAVALKDIYHDPDRLKKPVRKVGAGWLEIGWEEAFDEVAARIKTVREKYGRDSVALYQGNPTVHNLGSVIFGRDLVRALKTKNNFTATSVDQLPHHFASWAMLGHPLLLPVPDIDRTDHMLILGANPLASNGSIMTAPDIKNRLAAINARGKVVVIDPRKTETAHFATEHHFIRPGSDVFLLLAIVQVLFAEDLVKLGRLAEFTDGIEMLREIAKEFTPEAAETETGVPAEDIRRMAIEFGNAESGVIYGRMGVSTQKFGSLCQWLIYAINILTGNFDRAGGMMFTAPAFDLVALSKGGEHWNRWQSRVRSLPEFMGELPVSVLAEEIMTPGDGQVKAFVTSCGNPVLSTPNGGQLERALQQLDFMVSIDIYINETTRNADIILPPATGLENSHYDVIFNSLAVRNVAKYSPALFPKAVGAKYDWEIFQELAHRLSDNEGAFEPQPPEVKLGMALQFGPRGLSLETLAAEPHGVDLGALEPCLPGRLQNESKRIDLAPEILVKEMERLKASREADRDFPLTLIGRRHLRDCNSWLHNTERMMKGKNRCTVMINPADAERIGVADKQTVSVVSLTGRVELPAEVTLDITPGTVSIPHGYGHNRRGARLSTAAKYAGVSINDLTDTNVIDQLTGNAAFSNVRVRVEKKAGI